MTLGELLTALGYLTGALVLYCESRRRRLATPGMRIVALCGIVGGVVGARVSEWIFSAASVLSAHPAAILDPRNGGKSLVGGLIFGWISVEIAKRKLGIVRSTGDLWALALPAGEAVGRLGCFASGCCFGLPFHGPWAIAQHGEWRHPTQLYSALGAALIFAVLWKLRDSLPREGDLFRLYLLLYGLSRFSIEFARQRDFVWALLSTVQLICLEAVLFAAISLALSFRKAQRMNLA
jgi:phosphatidylglycerol:prolipoprotein diacylglycerol transferase